jgi:hypothetical protein
MSDLMKICSAILQLLHGLTDKQGETNIHIFETLQCTRAKSKHMHPANDKKLPIENTESATVILVLYKRMINNLN